VTRSSAAMHAGGKFVGRRSDREGKAKSADEIRELMAVTSAVAALYLTLLPDQQAPWGHHDQFNMRRAHDVAEPFAKSQPIPGKNLVPAVTND